MAGLPFFYIILPKIIKNGVKIAHTTMIAPIVQMMSPKICPTE